MKNTFVLTFQYNGIQFILFLLEKAFSVFIHCKMPTSGGILQFGVYMFLLSLRWVI